MSNTSDATCTNRNAIPISDHIARQIEFESDDPHETSLISRYVDDEAVLSFKRACKTATLPKRLHLLQGMICLVLKTEKLYQVL